MAPIIEFKHITKRFGGTTALSDVSFSVEKGEVGENGAGKSTLINLCGGVFTPTGRDLYQWCAGTDQFNPQVRKTWIRHRSSGSTAVSEYEYCTQYFPWLG